jgi:hypothetical protein
VYITLEALLWGRLQHHVTLISNEPKALDGAATSVPNDDVTSRARHNVMRLVVTGNCREVRHH